MEPRNRPDLDLGALAQAVYEMIRGGFVHLPDTRARATEHFDADVIARIMKERLEERGEAGRRVLALLSEGELDKLSDDDRPLLQDTVGHALSEVLRTAQS